ncbi:hypothetical protein D9M68_473150 [compost metagenome]
MTSSPGVLALHRLRLLLGDQLFQPVRHRFLLSLEKLEVRLVVLVSGALEHTCLLLWFGFYKDSLEIPDLSLVFLYRNLRMPLRFYKVFR